MAVQSYGVYVPEVGAMSSSDAAMEICTSSTGAMPSGLTNDSGSIPERFAASTNANSSPQESWLSTWSTIRRFTRSLASASVMPRILAALPLFAPGEC